MTLVLVVLFGLMLLGIPVAFAILSAGMAYLDNGRKYAGSRTAADLRS